MIRIFLLLILLLPGFSVPAQEKCTTDNKRALKRYEKAKDALRSKDFFQSEAYLNEALEKDQDFAGAWLLLARIQGHRGLNSKAIESYEKAFGLCPDIEAGAYYEAGTIYFILEDFKAAIEKLDTFLTLPDNRAVQTDKADSLLKRAGFLHEMYSNPVPYDPHPVPGISTKDGEYLPIISPDNELFFFTRSYIKKNKFSVVKESFTEDFVLSVKDSNGIFGPGEAMPEPFNEGSNEGGASVTIDNKELFITGCNRDDGYGSCDIYYTRKENGEWLPLQNMGKHINSYYWESQVSVSSDGKTLYFASDREGGMGGYDLYKITKDATGDWGKPVNLGAPVNTPEHEKSPFIHIDNKTLYFSSSGHPGLGRLDIFISRKDAEGEWMKPENIGYPINSKAEDMGFFVSTDGKKGYFSSNKLKGAGDWDIYSFNLYEGARPERVLFLKGKITDENGDIISDATIEVRDLKTSEVYEVPVDTASGEYVFTKTIDNDHMMTVQKKDHFYFSEYIDKDDTSFSSPSKVDVTMKKMEVGSKFVIEDLLFDTDSYKLKRKSELELDNLVKWLQMHPGVKIAIHGHTDNIGHDRDNQVLSQNRANTAFNYLVNSGISSGRLQHKGFGENNPVASNDTEAGRALNRRTEIVILEK